MKKRLALLLVFVLVISMFAACGGEDKKEEPKEDDKGKVEEEDKKEDDKKEEDKKEEDKKEEDKEEAKDDGEEFVVVVRSYGDPLSFNPVSIADDNGYSIHQNLFNRLVKLDASKSVVPDLAKEWEVSDDGMKITFYLKDNAFWHDGEKVTADDVKYTMDVVLENEAYFLNASLKSVDNVEVVDDYTVVFNMKSPDVAVLGYLGWYGSFIMPEHIFNNGEAWEDNAATMNPIGSGPFKFEEFKQGESVTLVKNENYHDGAPNIDRLIFSIIPDDATAVQAFLNGEIDDLGAVPTANVEELKANPDATMVLNEYPSPMMFVFNLNNEILQDVAVRKAIAMSIDKDEISKKVYNGAQEPEYNMYPSIVEWASNSEDTSPMFDIEGAKAVLEDAGYEMDEDGYYIRGLVVDVFEGYGYPDSAKLIQASLKEAGIELEVAVHEFNAWDEKVFVNKDFIAATMGGFQGPDPAALFNRVGTGGSMNLCGYSNPEVDKMFDEALAIGDKEKRAKIYKDIQAILAEDLPVCPIVKYAGWEAYASNLKNMPIEGAGKWGWSEYTFVEKK